MAENTPPNTLFGQFGLPELSLEKYEQEIKQMAPTIVRKELGVGFDKPGAFSKAAAGFAGLAGLGGANLTDEEKAKFKVVDQTRTAVKKMREESPELWEAMDEDQKADFMQTQMIRSANDNGLPEIGLSAARNLADRRVNRSIQQAELARVNQATGTSATTQKEAEQRMSIRDAGAPDDVKDFFDPASGRGVSGIVMPGGYVMVDGVRRHMSELIPANIYEANMRAANARNRPGSGGVSTTALFKQSMGAGPAKEARAQYGAYQKQHQITNRIYDLFEKAIEDGFNPASFIDGSGRLVSTLSNLSATMGGIIDAWRLPGEESGTNSTLANQYVDEWGEELGIDSVSDLIALPEGLTIPAAEYESMVVELAYAVARANEPGARQLSDTDFKNALKEIGAKAADPRKLIEITFRKFQRSTADMERVMNHIEGAVNAANTLADRGPQLPLDLMTESILGTGVTNPREQMNALADRRNELMDVMMGPEGGMIRTPGQGTGEETIGGATVVWEPEG